MSKLLRNSRQPLDYALKNGFAKFEALLETSNGTGFSDTTKKDFGLNDEFDKVLTKLTKYQKNNESLEDTYKRIRTESENIANKYKIQDIENDFLFIEKYNDALNKFKKYQQISETLESTYNRIHAKNKEIADKYKIQDIENDFLFIEKYENALNKFKKYQQIDESLEDTYKRIKSENERILKIFNTSYIN